MNGLRSFSIADRGFRLATIMCATLVSGCFGAPAVLVGPNRLYTIEEEVQPIRAFYGDAELWASYMRMSPRAQVRFRNELVTSRMYAIDLHYSKYEAVLLRDVQVNDFLFQAAAIGLSGTAAVLDQGSTTRVLSQIAAGTGSLNTAITEKILREQAIQNIQTAMRMARHEQAAIIFANLECASHQYPLGMALSDLEIYRRAGTFTTGLMRLTQTIQKAKEEAKEKEESQKPSGDKGVAKGKVAIAKAQAQEAKAKKQRRNPSCTAVTHERDTT
jgi:hypothetical protein